MKATGLAAILLMGALVEGYADQDNPYMVIATRNAFGLVEPVVAPPPSTTPVEPPKPASVVRLAGITSIFKKTKVIFEMAEAPGKPSENKIMTVGDSIGDLELVSVDVDNKSVTVNHAGTLTNLVLEAKKAPATPTAPKLPPGIRPGIRAPGIRSLVPPAPAAAAAASSGPTIIGRSSSGSGSGVVIGGGSTDASAKTDAAAAASRRTPYVRSLNSSTRLNTSARTIPTRTPRITQNTPSGEDLAAKQLLNLHASYLKGLQEGNAGPPPPPVPGMEDAGSPDFPSFPGQ